MIWFIVGLAVILGLLATIGITRNQFMSQKMWVILWTLISFSFAIFILVAFLTSDDALIEITLGGSFGFVVAISIHVLHHTLEEIQKRRKSTSQEN
ncbi:MAG: hypothetical protein RBG13Loki_4272 [Promethearchaeota archaeon CR_4]|nr:MAG: hypothetical protein RBG13Loki_4272 [Candidatus Lokiarchaeota archaeon CR_4]